VAVSKTHPAESVRAAFAAGLRDFGENRVQEASAKCRALADLGATWHLVGISSNKARLARELFNWVHRLIRSAWRRNSPGCGPQWRALAGAD